jgi:hypothetical protein
MVSVFVSYKTSNDMRKIESVVSFLKSFAAPVYYAPYDLVGGELMRKTFREAIANHVMFVALLADGYTESEYCVSEYNRAVNLERHMVFVRMDKAYTRPKVFAGYYILDYDDKYFFDDFKKFVTPADPNKAHPETHPLLPDPPGIDPRVIACRYVIELAEQLRAVLQAGQRDSHDVRFLWRSMLMLSEVIQEVHAGGDEKNHNVLLEDVQHIFYLNPPIEIQMIQIEKVIKRTSEILGRLVV